MNLGRTTVHPVLRFIALATLLGWVGAIALCQTLCCPASEAEHHPGTSDVHAGAAPVGEADHHHGNHHHNAPQKEEPGFCSSLQSLTYSHNSIKIFKPALQPLYALTLELSLPHPEKNDVLASFFRQRSRCNWVFTPEVCLGPAFRSLAPPSSTFI